MERKTFLKISGSLIGMTLLPDISVSWIKEKPIRLALLSDTHIQSYANDNFRDMSPRKNLEAIVVQISELDLDGMLINGDIARASGELGDYSEIMKVILPVMEKMPVFMAMGNHDNRINYFKVFGEVHEGQQQIKDKHVLVLERDKVRFILLDSLLYVDRTAGLLGKSQREWLKEFLGSAEKKSTFLFMHHPPGDGDTDLLDTEALLQILLPYKEVKALFFGHTHIYRFSKHEHIHMINLPATGYAFRDDQPIGWVEAEFFEHKGVFALHTVDGNQEKDGEQVVLNWE